MSSVSSAHGPAGVGVPGKWQSARRQDVPVPKLRAQTPFRWWKAISPRCPTSKGALYAEPTA